MKYYRPLNGVVAKNKMKKDRKKVNKETIVLVFNKLFLNNEISQQVNTKSDTTISYDRKPKLMFRGDLL